jgi:hypothetical protein
MYISVEVGNITVHVAKDTAASLQGKNFTNSKGTGLVVPGDLYLALNSSSSELLLNVFVIDEGPGYNSTTGYDVMTVELYEIQPDGPIDYLNVEGLLNGFNMKFEDLQLNLTAKYE